MSCGQLKIFFDRLYRYCDGFIEIRPIPGAPKFFPISNIEEIRNYLLFWKRSNNFYGVGTRDGKGGATENLVHIPAVWSDVDFKITPREALLTRLKKFPAKPTVINRSGGGVHIFWRLSEPAGPEDFVKVVDANRRIAAILGGDLGATDAARVLRPPTTFNIKYKPARLVEMTVCNQFEYDLQFFNDELPEVQVRNGGNGKSVNPPDWLHKALRGANKGQRNVTAAKISGYFINKLPRKDIAAIILSWAERCIPPMEEKEIYKVLNSIYRYRKREAKNAGQFKNYYADPGIQ